MASNWLTFDARFAGNRAASIDNNIDIPATKKKSDNLT
jgi:hypothetical protein